MEETQDTSSMKGTVAEAQNRAGSDQLIFFVNGRKVRPERLQVLIACCVLAGLSGSADPTWTVLAWKEDRNIFRVGENGENIRRK